MPKQEPLSTKHQVPSTKYQVPSTKYQVPSTKYQVPSTKYQVPSTFFLKSKSRAKQRGTSGSAEVLVRVLGRWPELFSGLFYVAASRLNSPRLSTLLIRLRHN